MGVILIGFGIGILGAFFWVKNALQRDLIEKQRRYIQELEKALDRPFNASEASLEKVGMRFEQPGQN